MWKLEQSRDSFCCKNTKSFLFGTAIIRESRKFCQRGSNSDNFILMRGNRIQIALKAGHHRPASETLNAGLVALWFFNRSGPVFAKKPYIFVIFQEGEGGGSGPFVPPLDPHMGLYQNKLILKSPTTKTTCIICFIVCWNILKYLWHRVHV